jgi:ectoine hydroxylase-related dioxygenase (phytanoyl-CoA dioxygenase family)
MKCADPNMERGRLRMQANRVARHPLLAPPSVCARRAMEPETVTEAAVARLRRVARHLLVAPPSDCTPTRGTAAAAATSIIPAADRARFLEDGYIVLHEHLAPPRLAEAREAVEAGIAAEGERAGWEQAAHFAARDTWSHNLRRLCNLLAKGQCFVALATEPLLLAYAQLCMPTASSPFHLQVFNAHDPRLGNDGGAIHSDRQLFADSVGHFTVIWALDDMTEANGATRCVPRSHRRGWPLLSGMRESDPLGVGLPAVDVGDPDLPQPGEAHCVCKAGSCVLVHGDCWHGQRSNTTRGGRLALHMAYASTPDTRPTYDIRGSLETTAAGRATLSELERRGLGQLVPPNHASWLWSDPQLLAPKERFT